MKRVFRNIMGILFGSCFGWLYIIVGSLEADTITIESALTQIILAFCVMCITARLGNLLNSNNK